VVGGVAGTKTCSGIFASQNKLQEA
jgi:hypothetical protein